MGRQYAFGALLFSIVLASSAVWVTHYSQPSTTGETPVEPAITDFEVDGPACVDQPRRNTALDTVVNDTNTSHTIRQNVTVPNASATLAVSELWAEESNYTLTLVSRDADARARDCTAQVRYTATVLLPEGRSDAYSLVVKYDGEVLTKVESSEDGIDASADARAGSDSETTNETA